jgi:NodT family efflux transporter outer membrane factor (OMF) lipoprotein
MPILTRFRARHCNGPCAAILRLGLRKSAQSLLPITLVLGLSACEAGPDYKQPSTALASFHNARDVAFRTAAAPPPLDTWWTGFEDPVLSTLIQRALDQNLDLSSALARVQEARASAQAAGAQLLPTFDATGQATAQRQSLHSPIGALARTSPGYNRDQRIYDVGAAASWEIDLAGGLRRGEEAADAEAQAAEANLFGTRISVAADVADAYFQIRGDQSRIAVVQQQVDIDAHLLGLVKQLFTQGVGNDREVAQAEAVLQQAHAALPPLRIALEAQLNRLDVLLGVQPGSSAGELSVSADIAALPGIPAAGTPTDFLRRRPDIIAAERQLAASNARIGVALSDYYPKLSLSGALGFDSLGSKHLFSASSFEPIGSGAIRWRIFDFGKIDAEVKQARGEHALALAQYRETVLHAAEDVENAFITLAQTEARTAQLQSEVQSLKRSRTLSQQAYAAGSIPLTDVLDADRQLLEARDDLAQNRADAARAAVRSFRALGGGWSPHQTLTVALTAG